MEELMQVLSDSIGSLFLADSDLKIVILVFAGIIVVGKIFDMSGGKSDTSHLTDYHSSPSSTAPTQPDYKSLGPPNGYNTQGGPGIHTNNPSHMP